MEVITANQITKIYPNGKKALNRVDLSIEEGEIFGFLGPNGAGKTTAVKLLNGMLQLTEGFAFFRAVFLRHSGGRKHGVSFCDAADGTQ